jgi:hypothetical protein
MTEEDIEILAETVVLQVQFYKELSLALSQSKFAFDSFIEQHIGEGEGKVKYILDSPEWIPYLEDVIFPLNCNTATIILSNLRLFQDDSFPMELLEFLNYHSAYVLKHTLWKAGKNPSYNGYAGMNFPKQFEAFVHYKVLTGTELLNYDPNLSNLKKENQNVDNGSPATSQDSEEQNQQRA